ncbi:hypothetical protein [Streptomyces sp. HNA39]|uniref:hypothetical protein n=1 Tax=Streptomyces sp. HNA39 TaxID=2850561 RepID=UPI00200E235F|nr:hypothetical protein [Streptomyces sp. HNA39]UQA33642.1 hypothetical protein KRR37_07625 [Streptomyces sp. HNA39]
MVRTVGGLRSGSVVGRQLLLFAALLFGIFTMHTVGHPAEHADPDLAAHAAPVSAHTGPAAVSAVGGGVEVEVDRVSREDAHHSVPASPDSPMSGMDPLSVCLAVLGAWGLALVGLWLFGARVGARRLGTPVGSGLLRVLRANPPPPISVLATVSVLRI